MVRRLGISAALATVAMLGITASNGIAAPHRPSTSPIQHVVILYQENHSFDNVLGALCAGDVPPRCDGATTGTLANGQQITLGRASDIVSGVEHNTSSQITAIDGGRMDGFSKLHGCTKSEGYKCYTQFQPNQIPNLAALAANFVISDRTFEMDTVPSFGAHLELAAATLDGFVGNNPINGGGGAPLISSVGWGCDSGLDTYWVNPSNHKTYKVPSCVPDQNGFGPYRHSPVRYVPTIMDRLDAAGLSWRFYSANGTKDAGSGYTWQICPTFAECLYSDQAQNVVPEDRVLQDAQAGNLPNFSIVLPNSATGETSQHNNTSMAFGDNYIGQVVSAIENGPDWDSTAIFITYDDCGCFYDHVPPPSGVGIRVPMVIVSPYAKPGYTDSTEATFASMLAFTEHTFGLEPLTSADAAAYDYSGAFTFSGAPRRGIPMVRSRVPSWELRWVAGHPDEDAT